MKRTKIIATIGPSTATRKKLELLVKSGMNAARVNFSHGTHESNGEVIEHVKKIREKADAPIGIIADLQGPRIRTLVDYEVDVERGETVLVYDVATEKTKINDQKEKSICLDWRGIIRNIEVGNDILIEDGLLKLRVVEKKKNYLVANVKNGGVVKSHKGVNIPNANLQIGAVTKKDEKDLEFALRAGVDFVALSFVSNAEEIYKVKKRMQKILRRTDRLPQIIAKIERKEAVRNIVEIIKVADIIMVARGDLGIEMKESRVVIYQKEIIARCLRNATPVIVATQMLNSMIFNPRPTRAEVADVSNAVIDHADAVMLSGETANGRYPVEAIKVMRDIIENTEASPFDVLEHGFLGDKKRSVSAAISHSAHELQKDTTSKAIVAASVSGFSARMIARHRPECPVYVMTNNEVTHNQLSLVWGVKSLVLPECKTLDELIDRSVGTLKKEKFIHAHDRIIILAGRPGVTREHMSLVKVEEIR